MRSVLFSLFIFAGIFYSAVSVQAATLYLDPGIATLFRGDAVTVSVRLMPDKETGECINVVDAVINYPDNVEPVDVSIGRSIFSLWVEPPTINKQDRTITFAGGVPNGYCGRVQGDPGLTNVIADIIFRSPGFSIGGQTGGGTTAVISFAPETQAYLNDNFGTKAELRTLPSTLTLEPGAGPGIVDDWRAAVQADILPPEEFSLNLVRDTTTFAGQYYIVFSTADKQTGLSHYEIIEEPESQLGQFAWGGADAAWIHATSPYVLKDQSLNSTIRVKAIDKAGNEYIAVLVPEESLRTAMPGLPQGSSLGIILGGFIFLLVVGSLVTWWYLRRRRPLVVDGAVDSAVEMDSDEEEVIQ